jgi:phosphate transport system substrate-binding protein
MPADPGHCGRRRALGALGALGLVLALPGRANEQAPAPPVPAAALALINRLPDYQPGGLVSGTVTLWGHGSFKRDFMGPLVQEWMTGLRRHQPGIALDYRMYGTASAISALFTGAGNLALLGEEISPSAALAFQRAKGYAPTAIEVATGSLDVNFFDYAHMIFVHRDNPIRGLTLQQLDGVFGAEHRRGASNIRRWGELGLKGEWASQRIQPYAWQVDEDFALFFREAVLNGSHRWNEATREYLHAKHADGSQYDHGQQILDALGQDRFGIAISNVRYTIPQVRPVPLARRQGEAFVTATPETLVSQAYPLVRIIPAYVDKPPGGRVEPAVAEFLRYLLSRQGQAALVAHSGYLPLGERPIAAQLAKLS